MKWTKVAREAAEDLFAVVKDAGEVGTGPDADDDWGYAGKAKALPKDGWGWEEKKGRDLVSVMSITTDTFKQMAKRRPITDKKERRWTRKTNRKKQLKRNGM